MSNAEFHIAPDDVIATLRELCRLQGDAGMASLLDDATGEIVETGYDNWGGGTTFYTLALELPLEMFARAEPEIGDLEASLTAKARLVGKNYAGQELTQVSIAPRVIRAGPVATGPPVTDNEMSRLWDPDRIRLFLSHVSAHKVQVGALKRELETRGASAFVAHEDITPSLEWQAEIVLSLRSMDTMIALVTPDFHLSFWTDQEVGIAIGRGVVVVPVRLPTAPYGFLGKWQGLAGDLADPAALAESIVRLLLGRAETHDQMKHGLVTALESASSFAGARIVTGLLESAPGLTADDAVRVRNALSTNGQVASSFGVPERLERLLG